MSRKIKTIRYRRKRQGKTDFKQRLKLLSSHTPRLAVRRSNKNITAQIIEFHSNGDKILAAASSRSLIKYGWKASRRNLSAAYLTGLLCGIKAKKKGIEKAIFDLGLYTPVKGSICYAVLKGAVDAGLKIKHSEEIFPKEERIKGLHIEKYAKLLSKEAYQKQFSQYIKNNIKPEELSSHFTETKNKILGDKDDTKEKASRK